MLEAYGCQRQQNDVLGSKIMDGEYKPSSFSTAGTEDPRFYEALGRAIKVLRAERGLSRRELAARSEVSYPYLSEIENGKKRPSSKALVAVATALGLRPSQLLETAESFVEVVSSPSPMPSGEPAPATVAYDRDEAGSRLSAPTSMGGPSSSGRIARMSQRSKSLPASPPRLARPGRSWFGGSVPEPAAPVDHEVMFDYDLAEGPSSREALIDRLRELANQLSDDDLERVLDLVQRLLPT
jgi:transcriptional regulator with XRE-family HTH domain